MNPPTVKELVTSLDLQPHPEGGFYRETWRDPAEGRGSGTAIYFLLPGGVESRWHRIDAVEIWHHYAGAPLELLLSDNLSSILYRQSKLDKTSSLTIFS